MSFSQYLDRYVWDKFPTWTEDPSDNFLWETEMHGSSFGVQYMESMQYYSRYAVQFHYEVASANGRSDIWDFNNFFDDHMGRWKGLWFPSFSPDLVLTSDIGASDTTLTVENFTDRDTYYPETPGTGRHIFIYMKSGSWYARKITSHVSGTSIQIDSALGVAVPMSLVSMVCYLYYGRFDQDEIEWEYVAGPTAAACDLYFIECPWEYPTS